MFTCIIFPRLGQQKWTVSLSNCDLRWEMDYVWQSTKFVLVVRPRWRCKKFFKVRIASKEDNDNSLMVSDWTDSSWFPKSRGKDYCRTELSGNQRIVVYRANVICKILLHFNDILAATIVRYQHKVEMDQINSRLFQKVTNIDISSETWTLGNELFQIRRLII